MTKDLSELVYEKLKCWMYIVQASLRYGNDLEDYKRRFARALTSEMDLLCYLRDQKVKVGYENTIQHYGELRLQPEKMLQLYLATNLIDRNARGFALPTVEEELLFLTKRINKAFVDVLATESYSGGRVIVFN